MLLVYGHYKQFYPDSAGIEFSRQILTIKVDPRTVRFDHSNEGDACFTRIKIFFVI